MLLPLLAASTACVTGGSPASKMGGDVVVVERSKEHPPSWVGAPTERLSDGEGVYRYVEISGRMRDLPLGLKQTQLKALEGARRVMGVGVKERVQDYGGARLTGRSATELQRLTDQTLDEIHGQNAKVADIYFERLVDRDQPSGTGEFYAVYILVHFPKDKAKDIYTTLGQRLSRSGDPNLKKLGPSIQSLAQSADLSH